MFGFISYVLHDFYEFGKVSIFKKDYHLPNLESNISHGF